MTRTDRSKRVDPSQADAFAELGRRLMHAGRAILDRGDAQHASALAILSVHAAIAFADVVTIHASGRKSTSGDHHAATRLLRSTMGPRLPSGVATAFSRLVSEKDKFEYQGYLATMREAATAYGHAEKVAAWAESVLLGTRRADSGKPG